MRWLRTFFRCSNHDNSNLNLDILVDDSATVVPDIAFAGWWGRIRTNHLWPAILQSDGKLDFGSDEDTNQNERFGWLDLEKRTIKIGEQFVLTAWGDLYQLTIESCVDLTQPR